MSFRAWIICIVSTLVLGVTQRADSAARSLFQDELIRDSDVIAVVDIVDRVFPQITGMRLEQKREVPVSPILYQSKLVESLYGQIPSEPLIFQLEGAEDRNPLEKGRYLLFLRSEGHFYVPMETDFRIDKGMVFWFTKPFITGGYGPEMVKVPLDQAVSEIKTLIQKYKKS